MEGDGLEWRKLIFFLQCDVTTVQMFRQDARRGKALFELWK